MSLALLAQAEREVGACFAEYDFRSGKPLPFGGVFDLIWCCAMLVHMPRENLTGFLETVWNGLKCGGQAIFISKQGNGETVVSNLGEDFPRVMVFYQPDHIAKMWRHLGGDVDILRPNLSTTAYGEAVFGVVLRK